MTYLLYGANGYTAQLIIEESFKQGLTPVLAGRTAEKIKPLAEKHKLDYRIFSLDNPSEIATHLTDVPMCLNAAGPFSKTAKPMVEACLLSNTHYLDITGEIAVFELVKSFHQKALDKNIMLMPGVGFDVVPSDCVANYLKEQMPDATHLELAFSGEGGSISHGTASTMIENLGEDGCVRTNGKIEPVPNFHLDKRIDFGPIQRNMATIPWGDVSTAYTSTKIPNIAVFTSVPKKTVKRARSFSFLNPILKTSVVKNLGQKWIDKNLTGPTKAQNENGKSYLYGKVTKEGESKEAWLVCQEGYKLTALSSVDIAKKVLAGNLKLGYQTPAMAYGWQLIEEISNSKISNSKLA